MPEQWLMGLTSLEEYKTVYNNTEKNNYFEIHLTEQLLKLLNIDTQLVFNVSEFFYETFDTATVASHDEFVKKDLNQGAEFHNLDKDQQNSINISDFKILEDIVE